MLLAIASAITGKPAQFRERDVSTVPGWQGLVVKYPTPIVALNQVRLLHDFLIGPNSRSSAQRALIALVALQNAHPLADGNGRLARIVFNLLLGEGAMRFYLPIREINGLSAGGVLGRIRAAEVGGEWEELSAVTSAAVRALYAAHRRAGILE